MYVTPDTVFLYRVIIFALILSIIVAILYFISEWMKPRRK